MIEKILVSETDLAETPHEGEVRKLYDFEHATVVHIKLEPGEKLHPHITPVDALFYGLEGEGTILIGENETTLRKDELVFSPKKIKHQLINGTAETFRFLVIKTPAAKEKTILL